jgi:hypothetical protein
MQNVNNLTLKFLAGNIDTFEKKKRNTDNVLKKKVVTVYSFLFIEYQFSWFFLIPSNHEI